MIFLILSVRFDGISVFNEVSTFLNWSNACEVAGARVDSFFYHVWLKLRN